MGGTYRIFLTVAPAHSPVPVPGRHHHLLADLLVLAPHLSMDLPSLDLLSLGLREPLVLLDLPSLALLALLPAAPLGVSLVVVVGVGRASQTVVLGDGAPGGVVLDDQVLVGIQVR